MSSLVSVELANNQIAHFFDKDIQRGDVNLPLLSFLSLNGNALTQIPSILKYMPKLMQLHLHMNRITDVKELCRPAF